MLVRTIIVLVVVGVLVTLLSGAIMQRIEREKEK